MEEDDIEKTITDVQRENCAGWGWTVVEKLVMDTDWSRQCLVDSWSLPINVWSAVTLPYGQPASLT